MIDTTADSDTAHVSYYASANVDVHVTRRRIRKRGRVRISLPPSLHHPRPLRENLFFSIADRLYNSADLAK
jgi:hypothetical protein